MVTMDNYEEYLLMYVDNELDKAQQEELMAFIARYPQLQTELKAYEATRLVPDQELVYQDKLALLHPVAMGKTRTVALWWRYSAAAGIMLLLGFGLSKWLLRDPDVSGTNSNQVAYQPAQSPEKKINNTIPATVTHQDTPMHPVQPTVAVAVNNKAQSVHSSYHNTLELNKETIESINASPIKPFVSNTSAVAITMPEDVDVNTLFVPLHEAAEKKRRDLLALLPISREKREGLEGLKNSMTEKINNTKNLAENLADADIIIKVGGKDLIVFNF